MAAEVHQLVMKSGPNPGRIYELEGDEVQIGRDVSNNVIINHAEVSRMHARMYIQAGGYVLEDAGSTNGTYIDGQRLVGPHLMLAGEVITLGESIRLAFETIEDEDATLAPVPTTPAEEMPYTTEGAPTPEEPEPVPPVQPVETFTPIQTQVVDEVPEQLPPVQTVPQPQPVEPDYESEIPISVPVEEEKEPFNWTWFLGGCGCLTIIACVVVAAAIVWIDAGGTERWCQLLGFLFPACP